MAGRLVDTMSVSLDGYAADADGSLDWVLVDHELHAQFNEESRSVATSLYGRRMLESRAFGSGVVRLRYEVAGQ